MLKDGDLLVSDVHLDGYKPITYEQVPDAFDQLTQMAYQSEPVDRGNDIYIGVVIVDLPPEEGMEF